MTRKKLVSDNVEDTVWLVWGEKKLAQLKKTLKTSFRKYFTPADGVLVELSHIAGQDQSDSVLVRGSGSKVPDNVVTSTMSSHSKNSGNWYMFGAKVKNGVFKATISKTAPGIEPLLASGCMPNLFKPSIKRFADYSGHADPFYASSYTFAMRVQNKVYSSLVGGYITPPFVLADVAYTMQHAGELYLVVSTTTYELGTSSYTSNSGTTQSDSSVAEVAVYKLGESPNKFTVVSLDYESPTELRATVSFLGVPAQLTFYTATYTDTSFTATLGNTYRATWGSGSMSSSSSATPVLSGTRASADGEWELSIESDTMMQYVSCTSRATGFFASCSAYAMAFLDAAVFTAAVPVRSEIVYTSSDVYTTTGLIPNDGCGDTTTYQSHPRKQYDGKSLNWRKVRSAHALFYVSEHRYDETSVTNEASSGCRTNGYARYVTSHTTTDNTSHHTYSKVVHYLDTPFSMSTVSVPEFTTASETSTSSTWDSTDWTRWGDWRHDAPGVYTYTSSESRTTTVYNSDDKYRDVFGGVHTAMTVSRTMLSQRSSAVSANRYHYDTASMSDVITSQSSTTSSLQTQNLRGEFGYRGSATFPEIGLLVTSYYVHVAGTGVVIGTVPSTDTSFSDGTATVVTNYAVGSGTGGEVSLNTTSDAINAAGFYNAGGGSGGGYTTTYSSASKTYGVTDKELYDTIARPSTGSGNSYVALLVYPHAAQTYAAVLLLDPYMSSIVSLRNGISAAFRNYMIQGINSTRDSLINTYNAASSDNKLVYDAYGRDPTSLTNRAKELTDMLAALPTETFTADLAAAMKNIRSATVIWSNMTINDPEVLDWFTTAGTFMVLPAFAKY